MNRLESLLIMCAASDKVFSFNFCHETRNFSCFLNNEDITVFKFNSTFTEVIECNSMYENLLTILKGE